MSTIDNKLVSPLIPIFDISHLEIYISRTDTLQYVYINPAALKNLQYSLEEILEMHPGDINAEFSNEEIHAISQQFKGTRQEAVNSTIHTRKDGSNYNADIQMQELVIDGTSYMLAFVQDTTEKVKAKARLEATTTGAEMGYWEGNLVTGKSYYNQRWLDMLGYEYEDVEKGREQLMRIVHPDDHGVVDKATRECVEQGKPFSVEFRMRHKAGHWVWIRSTGSALEKDPISNKVMSLCGTHADISEQKQQEQEKNQFMKLFYLSQDIMTITDLNKNICLHVNPAVERILGYTQDEFKQMPVSELHHPDDLEETVKAINNFKRSGNFSHFENRFRHKNGHYVWLSWQASLNKDEIISYAIARDITKEKNAEQTLRNSEQQYRALAENIEDIITQFGKDRRHVFVNDAITHTHGLKPEDFIGKTISEITFFHQKLRNKMENCLDEVFTSGEPRSISFEGKSREGINYIDWRASPLKSEDGSVVGAIAIARDISELKRIDEERNKVQKLNSLGILAGGIAHDFNNILTILFGNISMARAQLEEHSPGYDNLQKAEAAFNRATHLTTQLLTFAKGGEPVVQDISIASVISNIVSFDLSGSNVKLDYHAPDDLWMAQADESQIEQVFSNLTINANQAMPDGGVLKISLKNFSAPHNNTLDIAPGDYLKCVIKDSGTGITPANLKKIFDPYYSTRKSGSGLGLATVYSIITRHKGKILVESIEKEGTTFTLYLPATPQPSVKHPIDTIAIEPEGKKSSLKVLIMDDEDMICSLAIDMLSSFGHRAESANTGEQAIDLYTRALDSDEPYDALIMDLTIPGGMGGTEAIKNILAIDPEAKAIVSSGYAADPVMAHYKNYGFKGVIAKPFTAKSLREKIQYLFEES